MYKEIFTKFLIKFTTEKKYVKMSSGSLDKTEKCGKSFFFEKAFATLYSP